MQRPSNCEIELNVRGARVDRWSRTVPAGATQDQLPEIGRRCLLGFWKHDESGDLVPLCEPTEHSPIPDEVVIRAPDGRALYRWTIVEEKFERWFKAA